MYRKVDIEKKKDPLFQINNIAYARVPYWFDFSEMSLEMNIIRPQKLPIEPMPAIIWLCGGAWHMVDRAVHMPQLTYFAEHGFIIFSVTYRTSNIEPFPAALVDVKSAIRYVRAHAEELGVDSKRIVIMGESAGAHLACLAGVTGNERKYDQGDYLDQSSCVQAVVDWYGPTALFLNPLAESEIQREGLFVGTWDKTDERYQEASPITYITKDTPPFLILHGNRDELVPVEQSWILYEALQNAGVRSDFIEIEGAGHADVQFCQDETKNMILDFLKEVL